MTQHDTTWIISDLQEEQLLQIRLGSWRGQEGEVGLLDLGISSMLQPPEQNGDVFTAWTRPHNLSHQAQECCVRQWCLQDRENPMWTALSDSTIDTAKMPVLLIQVDGTTEATTRTGDWEPGNSGVYCKLAYHNGKELTDCWHFY